MVGESAGFRRRSGLHASQVTGPIKSTKRPKQLTLLICNYLFVMFKTDRHVSCLTATRNRWPRGMPSTLPSRVPEALGSSLSAAIVEPTGTTASIVPRSAVRMRGRSLACGRFRGERLLII
jgi:hypothetical protein